MPIVQHPDLLVGTETLADAAVYRLTDDIALVQTVDFFPPIVDDPYDYGAIAVANAVSDVYAMGATPLLALNIVGFPASLDKAILGEVLRGGYDKAHEAHLLIVGGHTVDDQEPKYGLAVTGVVRPGRHVSNAGARPGDILVLTKPLGTGIITTAAKRGQCPPEVLARAVAHMKALNRAASEAMVEVGVHAATDVTGFGLMGHLRNVCQGSGVGARVSLARVPVIEGTWALAEAGIAPGGTQRNLASVGAYARWHEDVPPTARVLLCDAQTSGGLLMAVPPERLEALLAALRARGVEGTVVGEATEDAERRITVEP